MRRKFLIAFGFFGLAFMVATAILLLSGPGMDNQPSLRTFEAEVNLPPEDAVFFRPEQSDPSTLNLPETTNANLQKGEVYYGYYCIFCHGDDGKGNGPVGQSYTPKPADLNNDSIKTYTLEKLYWSSFTGTGHSPVLERVIPEHQRPFILAYIKNGLDKL